MPKQTLLQKILNRETILYLVFGVLTTIVNMGVYWVSMRAFAALGWQGVGHLLDASKNYDYLDADIIAWVLSVLFAFVSNKLFVFESKSWQRKVALREFGAFVSARVVSLGVDIGGMFLLVSVLALDVWAGGLLLRWWDIPLAHSVSDTMVQYSLLAKCIVQVLIVLLNYAFSKWFIFKKK
ncbi:MAG: GtrA family protein [Oscillospiraceae bacterium]|jgi:putative flippase GtrA|nr:GtrA family protein [Oscillospiraceae bacterium]